MVSMIGQSDYAFLGKFAYTQLTILFCYNSILLPYGNWEDGGFSTLFHSCGSVFQNRLLKIFPGPGYPLSEDDVV